MWEITSPRSADIPDKDLTVNIRQRKKDGSVEPTTRYRHFNPDGVALMREPLNNFSFNVLETDNNTNNPKDMRAKFEAFIAYDRQGKFGKLIELYARKYHLEIPNPEDIGVCYLFVASNYSNDHRRRNQAVPRSSSLRPCKTIPLCQPHGLHRRQHPDRRYLDARTGVPRYGVTSHHAKPSTQKPPLWLNCSNSMKS